MIVRGYPDCAKALNLMGITYSSEKHWPEALAWFDRATHSGVLRDVCLYNTAYTYVETRDYARAVDLFREALAGSPTPSIMHLGLGWALEKSGDWEGATREYSAALEQDPSNAQALKWAVKLYRAHGHPELAAQFDTRYGLASAHTAQPPQAGG